MGTRVLRGRALRPLHLFLIFVLLVNLWRGLVCAPPALADGSFTNVNAGLVGVEWGKLAWGDYDNDGDLDILLTGQSADGPTSRVYRNDGGSFTQAATLTPVYLSSAAWGDYDNDGYLDILLSGDGVPSPNPTTVLYRNNRDGTFTAVSAGLAGLSVSWAAWGDYDRDRDLDLLIMGYTGQAAVTHLYRNESAVANARPTPPAGLAAWQSEERLDLS